MPRRPDSLLPACRAASLTAGTWTARAVLAWAVLAGLFFMHGAASSAGGCQGGAPGTAVAAAVMPADPGAVAARPLPGDPHLAGTQVPAAAGPAVAGTPAGPAAPQAASVPRGSCDGGMLCSSRPPRQDCPGGNLTPPASVTVAMAAPALPGRAAAPRPPRPPGRPGLPLPLFLGVSRT
jgi:hypothetical protein